MCENALALGPNTILTYFRVCVDGSELFVAVTGLLVAGGAAAELADLQDADEVAAGAA